MISRHHQHGVDEREQKTGHTGMPAVVEQWQKLRIQPAKRTDAQNDVQEQKCCCAEGAHHQNLLGDEREKHLRHRAKRH